ncbi:hypothetical protein PybrP1_013216 [[Pythium] brassicae (nom. inval.)]|nr:hypothetical protein PybrP1_013216 [[Pythium] brassicae (nom. inval.)]
MSAVDFEACEQLRRESEELCFLQQLRPARDKALAALKAATALLGKNSLRLAPFYLVLADVALRERQLQQAEELLALVNWLLVRSRGGGDGAAAAAASGLGGGPSSQEPLDTEHAMPEEATNLLVIRMNKLYSALLLEREAFPEALQHAAHGAYHCALLFGPEHLYTSELYFCLGAVFSRMQQIHAQPHAAGAGSATSSAGASGGLAQLQRQQRDGESALGMFDKVVDIWYRFLTNPPEDTAAWVLEHQRLRVYEASRMLHAITQTRSTALGASHVATGEALYTQGLVSLFLGDHAQAKAFVQRALAIYSDNLGPDHPSAMDVRNVLQQLQDAGV